MPFMNMCPLTSLQKNQSNLKFIVSPVLFLFVLIIKYPSKFSSPFEVLGIVKSTIEK